jgi:hypothetical protein
MQGSGCVCVWKGGGWLATASASVDGSLPHDVHELRLLMTRAAYAHTNTHRACCREGGMSSVGRCELIRAVHAWRTVQLTLISPSRSRSNSSIMLRSSSSPRFSPSSRVMRLRFCGVQGWPRATCPLPHPQGRRAHIHAHTHTRTYAKWAVGCNRQCPHRCAARSRRSDCTLTNGRAQGTFRLILPVLSSSNSRKAFEISSSGSLERYLSVTADSAPKEHAHSRRVTHSPPHSPTYASAVTI